MWRTGAKTAETTGKVGNRWLFALNKKDKFILYSKNMGENIHKISLHNTNYFQKRSRENGRKRLQTVIFERILK